MDNWGDPWADHNDNAHDAKSPNKIPVASPLPPSFAPAPTVLNGFLDDAGWGNDDDDFGDWTTSTGKELEAAPRIETREHEPSSQESSKQISTAIGLDADDGDVTHDTLWGGEHAASELEPTKAKDATGSEAPGSPTATHEDDAAEDIATHGTAHQNTDSSPPTQHSTPLSDLNYTDVPVESARISHDEQQEVEKATTEQRNSLNEEALEDTGDTATKNSSLHLASISTTEDGNIGGNGAGVDNGGNNTGDEEAADLDSAEPPNTDVSAVEKDSTGVVNKTTRADRPSAFNIDQSLLLELFPPPTEDTDQDDAPDDPIYSTAGRKAWYRLTRKQTLREFNNGNDDDNYVRVTWANSQIRTEVNKIVGRWAREDRISGTGPGARASFYWDTPAPSGPVAPNMHSRHHSVIHNTTAPVPPNRQSLPPLSTNNNAAFNWSSPSSSLDPWQSVTPSPSLVPLPVAPPSPAIITRSELQAQNVSIGIKGRGLDQTSNAQTLSAPRETPAVSTLMAPPVSIDIATSSDPWTAFDNAEPNSTLKTHSSQVLFDGQDREEDDWGEMVSSPTVSTPITDSISQATTRNNTLSTSATPPQSIKAISIQDQSPDTMHAAPIVRLKSTVSPTSALFRNTAFIPLGAEREPIGPGILKPVNRSVSSNVPNVAVAPKAVTAPRTSRPELQSDRPHNDDGTSSGNYAMPASGAPSNHVGLISAEPEPHNVPAMPSTPTTPAAMPMTQGGDSWADVDLSFFESAEPAAVPNQSRSKQEPSSPPAISQTPPRTATSTSPARSFTRSSPRNATPPPLQPLSGATSSAQQRKAEEDRIIQDITKGFPDLTYMLR